jgi:hypothetical protein
MNATFLMTILNLLKMVLKDSRGGDDYKRGPFHASTNAVKKISERKDVNFQLSDYRTQLEDCSRRGWDASLTPDMFVLFCRLFISITVTPNDSNAVGKTEHTDLGSG